MMGRDDQQGFAKRYRRGLTLLVPGFLAGAGWRRLAAAAATVFTSLYLAGCASQRTAPATPSPAPTVQEPTARADPATPPSAAPNPLLLDFQSRQRQGAEAAEQRGHWAEALTAWDVLLALNPADAELQRRRNQAQQTASRAAQDKLQAARAAPRNDGEAATRLYLEVLALAPTNTEAADALRQLERDRVRRQHLGQLSRNVLTRRGGESSTVGTSSLASVNLGPAARPSSERNELEHASLLAGQGEIDSAIQLIRPLAQARNPDPAARQLLAELYYRQAETLANTNRPAAIAALEQCLQTEPSHTKAAAKLRELRGGPANAATKTIPRKPAPATSR